MTRQIVLQSPPVNRRQPLLTSKQPPKNEKHRIGEMAGGTTAECAAVCCCCPCAVLELVVLTVYKVPAGLCKKAWNKKKRQKVMRNKKKLLEYKHQESSGATTRSDELSSTVESDDLLVDGNNGATEAVDVENEMWEQFYGTGFWRSHSQRAD